MSMVIVDLPGLKAGEDAPEEMVRERLSNPGVVPVVVLDPKDLESAHYVYKVLESSSPHRCREDIIALVNKTDEKMTGNGEWSNRKGWAEQYRGVHRAGFKE